MTDKFMSYGERTTSKVVMECENLKEAETVYNNMLNRSDMKYVNICSNMPRYPSHYNVYHKDKTDYPEWFIAGYF